MTLTLATQGHGGHGQGHGQGTEYMHQQMEPPTSFSDPAVIGDQEHMKEHLKGEINTDNVQMTPEQMEFHYFRLHDANNDTHLDGLELLKALSHMMPPPEFAPHEINNKAAVEVEQMKSQRIREMLGNYVQIIDNVLKMDDKDGDGYLSYAEYSLARRRDAAKMKQMQEQMIKEANKRKEEMLAKQNQPYQI